MTTASLTTPLLTTDLVRHDSPVGRLEIRTRFDRLVGIDIERDGRLPGDDDGERCTVLHDEVRRQLDDYFAGRRTRFDLPLDRTGTAFQTAVWKILDEVPWGTAVTYGDLALRTGRPTGARAVGGAVRANRIAIVVPCHRVLGATGGVTGYTPGDGVVTKTRLLRHEGIAFRE
jgi:methylated-DNA-[protein]-cysteine S-methyltransferase